MRWVRSAARVRRRVGIITPRSVVERGVLREAGAGGGGAGQCDTNSRLPGRVVLVCLVRDVRVMPPAAPPGHANLSGGAARCGDELHGSVRTFATSARASGMISVGSLGIPAISRGASRWVPPRPGLRS
jgi:hypothetical protein